MKPGDPARWQRVSPLSVLFYVGQILRAIARHLFQAVVPAAVLLLSTGWTTERRLYTLAGVLLFLLVLVAAGRYLRFRFRIDDTSVGIRQGIFRREALEIAFDRIQGINTTQNPVYRLFGLVDVKMDTAGSAASEGHLPAVPVLLAEELRRLIRRRPNSSDADPRAAGDAAERPADDTVLALSSADMVRIGLSSNRGLILLAFLAPLLDNLDERLQIRLEEAIAPITDALGTISASGAAGIGLILFVVAVFSLMAISIVGAFLRFGGFTLTTDGEVIRSRGGLLTTHEHSMSPGKLQVLRIRQGPILRVLGRFRLVAKQAASHAANTRQSFLIPLAPPAFLEQARAVFLGKEASGLTLDPGDASFRPISRRYVRSRTLLFGAPAASILLAIAMVRGQALSGAVMAGLVLGIAWLIAGRRSRRWGLLLTQDAVAVRRGLVGTTLSAFLLRKVQRVDITRSPFQRRHGLANLRFVLAAETVTVPYVDERLARHLRDYVLYRVEDSRLAWI